MCQIIFRAGDAGGIDFSAPTQTEIGALVTITVLLNERPRRDVLEGAALDLITYTLRGPGRLSTSRRLISTTSLPRRTRFFFGNQFMPDTCTRFPNLRTLSFDGISLLVVLPESTLVGDGKAIPSLEYVLLQRAVVDDDDRSTLTTFLSS